MIRLLKQRRADADVQRQESTNAAKILQKRAEDKRAEERRIRDAAILEKRQAELDNNLAAERKANAETRQAEARKALLQTTAQLQLEERSRQAARAKSRAEQKWLQLEYPVDLAMQMSRRTKRMSTDAKTSFKNKLKDLAGQNWFRFMPRVPELWEIDKTLLIRYTDVRELEGPHTRVVRCSVQLDAYLDQVAPPSVGGLKDATKALGNLMEAAAPGSSRYVEWVSKTFV